MKEYTFVLTEQEANVILGVLAEQPFKVVNDLMQKLHKQANEQQVVDEVEPEVSK